MKKHILIFGSFFFLNLSVGQQQLQNSGFENWDNEGAIEQEPTHWSSLKTADDLASMAPEVLSRVAGRTGNYAVELKVKTAFGVAANGIVTNGRVHADFNPDNGYVFTDANDPKWHTTFTDRPDSIVGWYKYFPENNDQGKIEIILHKGTHAQLPKDATTSTNEVGHARFDFTTGQSEWMRFSTPFTYISQDNPAYVLTTITSGDSTIAKEGSKLQIDDLELVYNSLNTKSFVKEEIAMHAAQGHLFFDLQNKKNVTYSVANITGKIVQSGKAKSKTPFDHETGIYFVQIETAHHSLTKKLYIQR